MLLGHPPLSLVIVLLVVGYGNAEDHHKRAPSGFTGVRGKKSAPDETYYDDSPKTDLAEKRAPSGFLGMRGKKPWDAMYSEELLKRAPSGFMGMRGKKDDADISDLYDTDFYKRGYSGFMGVRGKKEMDTRFLYQPSRFAEKRAQMGFVGMRGKKEIPDDLLDEAKRTPAGFFGMRGKKQPRQSGFFGMRGKKYPYEFRGKFVGVRGKKLYNDFPDRDYYRNSIEDNYLNRYGQELDLNQLMLLLTENEGDNSDSWAKSNEGATNQP